MLLCVSLSWQIDAEWIQVEVVRLVHRHHLLEGYHLAKLSPPSLPRHGSPEWKTHILARHSSSNSFSVMPSYHLDHRSPQLHPPAFPIFASLPMSNLFLHFFLHRYSPFDGLVKVVLRFPHCLLLSVDIASTTYFVSVPKLHPVSD